MTNDRDAILVKIREADHFEYYTSLSYVSASYKKDMGAWRFYLYGNTRVDEALKSLSEGPILDLNDGGGPE